MRGAAEDILQEPGDGLRRGGVKPADDAFMQDSELSQPAGKIL